MKKNVFNSAVLSHREEVINGLCCRYKDLRREDAEDIVQDSCCALWKWSINMSGLTDKDFTNMWKVMSRNTYTHWVSKTRFTEEWDDGHLQYGWEERDFGWAQGCEAKIRERELFYDYLDTLKEKDRRLMELLLTKTKMKDIAEALGYKNEQVAKNRKRMILKTMQSKLAIAA